jgi:glutathione S-transferase
MRDRLAEAEAGSPGWRFLKGTVRRAFDTFEVLRVQDGVPILYFRPFKVRAYTYQETGIVEKVVVEVYGRSAKGEEIGEWYDALDVMERHLAGDDFFVGGRYTVADIALYAYTHVAHEGGFDLAGYPTVRAWMGRVAAQPGHIPITQG